MSNVYIPNCECSRRCHIEGHEFEPVLLRRTPSNTMEMALLFGDGFSTVEKPSQFTEKPSQFTEKPSQFTEKPPQFIGRRSVN